MSGGFNPINLVSQAALGIATGGMSLYAQLATQLLSSIGQQVIGELGQQMGLPDSMISLAKGAFAAEMGDFSGATQNYQEAVSNIQQAFPNASPSEMGDLQRGADETYSAVQDIARGIIENGNAMTEDADGNVKGSGKSRGAQSWLMAIAKGLANMLTQQAQDLQDKMDGTNWKDAGESAEFQAQSQQFNLAMSTATNAIKTIGEALSTMARKG